MRVCIYLGVSANMSDKCERAIIFVGANYRPMLKRIAFSYSYMWPWCVEIFRLLRLFLWLL